MLKSMTISGSNLAIYEALKNDWSICCSNQRKWSETEKKNIYKGFVFITLYCDLLVDSLAVLRNNTERAWVPFTQFPPMVTSCKTIMQYQNQYIDIDTVKSQNTFFTTRIPHHVALL